MDRQKQYNTRSRSALVEFFERHGEECLSAKDVIASGEVDIGEATVYRLLTKLTQQGVLQKSLSRDGAGSLYQLAGQSDCGEHFHLKCLDCGCIIHMHCRTMNSLEKHIESEHSFTVDNAFTVIYGHCGSCKEKSPVSGATKHGGKNQ